MKVGTRRGGEEASTIIWVKGKSQAAAETLLTNDRVYHISLIHGGLWLSGAIRKESR